MVKKRTQDESAQLEDFKEALAMLSGLECASISEVEKRLAWRTRQWPL